MGVSAKHNGWRNDNANNRLDVYQNGTKVGYFDSVSGLKILTGGVNFKGGMTVSGTTTFAGTQTVSGNQTVNGTFTLRDAGTFADAFYHASANKRTISGDVTLTVTDAGKILEVSGAGLSDYVIAFPAPMDVGMAWTVVNLLPDGTTGGVKLDVSGEKWFGCGLSGLSGVDLINDVATAKRGDYVKLMAGATGVYIMEMAGTWSTT